MTEEKIRVLLVEDDQIDQMAFERAVKAGALPYDYRIAGSLDAAREALASGTFDIVLTDFMLGDGTGLDVVAEAGDTPIIVVTGTGDEETAVKAMKQGARDYLIKDPEGNYLKTLPATVQNVLDHKRAEDELEAYRERLEELVGERTAELERANRALRDSEQRLRAIFEQTEETIVITDSDFAVQYANPATESITGYSPQDLAGQEMSILVSDDMYREIRDTVTRGEIWRGNSVDQTKDGAPYEVEASVTPIRDADGRITNYVGVARDVTHEKDLEKQLREAQKMEAIGTLAGGIAHDFNNILMPVMGYTEMALEDVPEDSLLEANLQEVLSATQRAVDLVKQILTFSRQREQERKPVRVGLIAKEATKLLRASLPSTIQMDYRSGVESDLVMADPTQIHQVIMNLCTNAAHAMRETGGRLEVTLSDCAADDAGREPGTGNWLRLSVTDTGHGIPAGTLARIFEPYFTTKDKQGGTGLGLAVVHGIIESHAGAITVESEVGKGTTFHVLLPLIETEAAPERDDRSAEEIQGEGTILFVDDEATIVNLAQRMLESFGFEVVPFTGSVDALAAFREDPGRFDAVVTDMTMPNLTGVDLTKEILQIRPDTPIVLCTGFSELITPEQSKTIGIREFVMKPLLKRKLGEAVQRALSANGG